MNALLLVTVLLGVTIAAIIDDKVMEKMKMDFLKVDMNKNGRLEEAEFLAYYNNIDSNNSHHLKEDEYMKVTGDDKAHADFVFKYFDVNQDGDITPEDVKKVFTSYDANKDGYVSYHEFMMMEEERFKMMWRFQHPSTS